MGSALDRVMQTVEYIGDDDGIPCVTVVCRNASDSVNEPSVFLLLRYIGVRWLKGLR